MKRRLHKSFTLLLFFFILSNCLLATPECPIVTGKFNLANGTTVDASPTGWSLDASNVTSTGFFYVKSNRLTAQTMGGEGIWYSHVFSTAGYSSFQAAVKITAEGQQDNTEYVKIYYKIDGGPLTLLDSRTGNFGTIDFTSGVLTGSNIQLIVKIYDYKHGSQASKYYIEQYRVFKEKGPCAISAITVTAGANGSLTCNNTSTTLSATASGSGTTTWSWTGPNGFTSNAQNPTVSTAGTYTVVANNSSGTGSASVTVTANTTPPTASATGGTLTCAATPVTLNATSSANNSTYSWTGPNSFTSNSQNPTVSTAGTYFVTVTDPVNGCTGTATATVDADTARPDVTASATPIQLTCVATNATLNGSSSISGVTYSWSNGSGVIATTPNASISTAGTYTLTVTNPANSCTASSQVVVTQNITPPTGIAASNAGTVTCSHPTVSITGTVSTSGLTYSWIGPNGFTSSALDTSVTKGGTYTLTATDPTNGCSASTVTVVAENTTAPGEISINNSGIITCLTSSVTISGSSSTTGVNYMWTGPNGYSSTSSSITVTHGGLYTLTATDPGNGCKASKSTTVAQNSTPPVVTITNTNPLSCAKQTDTLTASSATPDASYLWIAPDGSASVTASTIASQAGTYTVTVTDPANGCTNTLTTDVTGDPTCSARIVTGGTANTPAVTTAVSSFTHGVYPNPVISHGVIQFISPTSTTLSVGIYNTLGACEKVLFKGVATANQQYRLTVPVDQLHAGAYYYIINTNGKVYTGKLVIVR